MDSRTQLLDRLPPKSPRARAAMRRKQAKQAAMRRKQVREKAKAAPLKDL
jgi:hypothetical protein